MPLVVINSQTLWTPQLFTIVTLRSAMITNFFTSSHDPGSKVPAKVHNSSKKSRSDRLQNSKFKPQWSKIFPCIYFDADADAMYCKDCKTAKMINSFTIGCQTMLKDNIQKHIKSADHKKAIQTKIMRTDWDQGIATANKTHEKEVTAAMSNIYWMAKHNLSTSLYNGVNDLLDFHGVESVSAIQKAKNAKYTSSDSVLDMQIALAKVVDEEIIEDMKASIYYSVMLDESTDRTTEKTLMLYVRYIKSNVSVTRFLSVLELSGGTADVIFTAVKTLFDMYDLDFSKCISISTDGASVMTGIRSGVTTKFSEQNPFIIKTHCIAHRLALASSQAANSINYLKKYQGTLNEVYKYYHHSCKHMSELKAMATIFDKAEKRFQEVFSTRWLSFEGSVSSLLHNFDILIGCLLVDEEGGNIVAGGLVRFISTYEFLAVSHFMGDVMGIVCRVSRVFQREDLTFSVIKDVIDPACAAILGMKSTAGPKLESFLSEVPSEVQESGNFLFGGNLIKDSPSQRSNFESLRVKFIDQLVLNLQSRFPSQQIFQSLSIFDPQFVPSAGSQELLSYGKEQVDFLCKHFGQDKGGHKALISEVHFREEWFMFKQVLPGYKGVRMDSALSSLLCKDSFAVDYPNVANFLSICLVSALSSVDCERGFSRYNLIKTYLRNRLMVSSVNTLLKICLHPSDLRSFRFRRAFELWCKAKDRRILFY